MNALTSLLVGQLVALLVVAQRLSDGLASMAKTLAPQGRLHGVGAFLGVRCSGLVRVAWRSVRAINEPDGRGSP